MDEQVLLQVDECVQHLLDDVGHLVLVQVETHLVEGGGDVRDWTKAAELHHIPDMTMYSDEWWR